MNTIVDRIKKLADKQHMSIAELERKLGFSNGQIRRWGSATPGVDKVEKVADFFNVSIPYLLGKETYAEMEFSRLKKREAPDKHEQETLVLFRKETADMTDEEKERFNNALSGLFQTARNLIKDDE